MLSGFLQKGALNFLHQAAAVPGEQFHRILGGFIGAQKAIVFIAAAAVYRRAEDIVQAQNTLRAVLPQNSLGARPGMDIAGEHVFSVLQNGAAVVGKDNFHLCPGLTDHIAVILHICLLYTSRCV